MNEQDSINTDSASQEVPGTTESGVATGRPLTELTVDDLIGVLEERFPVLRQGLGPGVRGAHVNSGPPGHVNEPGHANFDPRSRGTVGFDPIVVRGAHVNSGPPGHANEPGHANFDPPGSHVNSGPPGHANEPGHANFDPHPGHTNNHTNAIYRDPDLLTLPLRITLPDGGKVTIPPGRIDVNVRGFRIQR